MTRVAFVSGSNRGLGFSIVKLLCQQFDGDVYLTSRDVSRGKKAVEELNSQGLHPKYHPLDTCDAASIQTFREFLKANYGGVDVFVNNAAIAFKKADPTPFTDQAEISVQSNYFSYVDVFNAMFPILKPGARIVHISSTTSCLLMTRLSPEKVQAFVKATNVEEVNALLREFVSDVKEGKHLERGWVEWATGVSKVGVTAITALQQAGLDKAYPGKDMIVNVCCPGHLKTEMSSWTGHILPDEGADTPAYLATLPPGEQKVRGAYVHKRKVYDWRNGEYSSYS